MPQKKTEKHPVHRGEETIMFFEGITETTIKTIGIDKIDLDRNEFEFRLTTRFKDLKEDIYQNGQQFPIIVRKIPDTYQYQVISGFRRVRALLELEIPEVKPVLFFVPRPKGKKGKINQKNIDEMETYLIMEAKRKNPDLLNLKKAKDRGWEIRNITTRSPGKAKTEEKLFRNMLKKKTRKKK